MRKSLRKVVAAAAAGVMTLALALSVAPNASAGEVSDAGKKAAKAEFDGSATYHAYFGLQQADTWIFRDPWYSPTLGIDGTSLAESNLTFDCGTLLQSKNDGVAQIEGTEVLDAEITGNGTYVVGVSGINGALSTVEADRLSMLYVDTDIPMTAKDSPVTISDWKLTIDGMEQALSSDVYFPSEYTDVSGLLRFDALNTYQKEKGDYEECPTVTTPNDTIYITFTVSGFDNDNADATGVIPGTEPEDDASSTSATSTSQTDSESSGPSTAVVVVIVIAAIVVIGGVVVVVTKKKK